MHTFLVSDDADETNSISSTMAVGAPSVTSGEDVIDVDVVADAVQLQVHIPVAPPLPPLQLLSQLTSPP